MNKMNTSNFLFAVLGMKTGPHGHWDSPLPMSPLSFMLLTCPVLFAWLVFFLVFGFVGGGCFVLVFCFVLGQALTKTLRLALNSLCTPAVLELSSLLPQSPK